MLYLKIENPGLAPREGFTMLGATSKRGTSNQNVIGQFGSGAKHGVSLLLRHNIVPVVFVGNLRMDFGVKSETMKSDISETEYNRVFVKYSGRNEDGSTNNRTEDLGFVLEYGSIDWNNVGMALREFVSNAIDHTIEKNEYDCRKCKYPWDGVVVELVQENQVRAKAGYTRVFVPLAHTSVASFHDNLGKWFLHFSEPDKVNQVILPKDLGKIRSLDNTQNAVIYRKGVLVREFAYRQMPSIFDYNLPNLTLDECRNASDWTVKAKAAEAIGDASLPQMVMLLRSFQPDQDGGVIKYWEHTFEGWSLKRGIHTTKENRMQTWEGAIATLSPKTVVCSQANAEAIKRKGYNALVIPAEYMEACENIGVRKTATVLLDKDEREGREVIPASDDTETLLLEIWEKIAKHGMTNGKDLPKCANFRQIMQGETYLLGFYRDGCVYLNESLSQGQSMEARQTMLEEIVHYITGSTDNSRDFQDYAFKLATNVMFG